VNCGLLALFIEIIQKLNLQSQKLYNKKVSVGRTSPPSLTTSFVRGPQWGSRSRVCDHIALKTPPMGNRVTLAMQRCCTRETKKNRSFKCRFHCAEDLSRNRTKMNLYRVNRSAKNTNYLRQFAQAHGTIT